MKGSLIVVGFFALGLLAGRSGCMPTWLMEGDISMVALCALLLFVGIGIGLNPDMKSELKSLSPRLALRFRDRLHRPLPRHPLVRISVASLRRMVRR